jgi:L-amino acid N-acyltransferase YncA
MSLPPVHLRAAEPKDIPGISTIHEHYTLHTVITFKKSVTTPSEHLSNLSKVHSQRLPYIVAVSKTSPEQNSEEQVLGSTYCTGFRDGKAGYIHTVELSLFCHPEHRYRGIGTMLLNELLEALAHPEKNREYYKDGVIRGDEEKVRQVLAVMAVDTDGKEDGMGLKRWYECFGFVERGRLKEVGFKLGRWIDTVYLQRSIW